MRPPLIVLFITLLVALLSILSGLYCDAHFVIVETLTIAHKMFFSCISGGPSFCTPHRTFFRAVHR